MRLIKAYKHFYFGFLFFFASTVALYGQGFVIDTTGFLYETDTLTDGPDEYNYDRIHGTDDQDQSDEGPAGSYRPGDLIFVPRDVVNSERWDTLYIRTGKADFSKFETPQLLVLDGPDQGQFYFPFRGNLLSPYGRRGKRFHAGTDIKLELGDTVRAAFNGKVRISRVMSGYGKMVLIRHTNGLETLYGHLSKILVKTNQEVKAGDPIGLGGRTGRATTTHLHFETRFLGEHFNPAKIIDYQNFCLKLDTLLVDKNLFGVKPVNLTGSPVAKSGTAPDETGDAVTAKYHTIKQGDTLYAIALRYKTTVKRICKLNGIPESKKLRIGNRLRVK